MADMLEQIKAKVRCCACRGPIGERVNVVDLDRLATWKHPVANNFLTGERDHAVAFVCDRCVDARRPIEEAVELNGEAVVYHRVSELKPVAASRPDSDPLHFEQTAILADNRWWTFCVGRIGERWLGYAVDAASGFGNVFPQVSEDNQLGLRDYGRAAKLTTALAQDPEQGLGEVERWFIPEGARGKPEDFRCGHCEQIGCSGVDCVDRTMDPDAP